MKSLNKLQQKDLSPELFNFKVLQIFLFYLEKNTLQFKHLEGQNAQCKIWIDHQSAELGELKKVIINNFFSAVK